MDENIKKEVEEIINNFVNKLNDLDKNLEIEGKDFYLIERFNLRKENNSKTYYKVKEEFRKLWFKTSKNNDGEFILAEKASWKK